MFYAKKYTKLNYILFFKDTFISLFWAWECSHFHNKQKKKQKQKTLHATSKSASKRGLIIPLFQNLSLHEYLF